MSSAESDYVIEEASGSETGSDGAGSDDDGAGSDDEGELGEEGQDNEELDSEEGQDSDAADSDDEEERGEEGQDNEVAQRTWYIGLKNNTAATLCPLIAVIQLLYHHPLCRAAVEATDPLTWEFQANEGAQAAVAELRSLFHMLDVRDAAADASKFAGLLTNVNTFRDHASTWNVNLTGEQQDAMEMLQAVLQRIPLRECPFRSRGVCWRDIVPTGACHERFVTSSYYLGFIVVPPRRGVSATAQYRLILPYEGTATWYPDTVILRCHGFMTPGVETDRVSEWAQVPPALRVDELHAASAPNDEVSCLAQQHEVYQLQAVVCYTHDSGSYKSGHYTTWSRVEDGNFVHFNLGEVSPRGHSFTEVRQLVSETWALAVYSKGAVSAQQRATNRRSGGGHTTSPPASRTTRPEAARTPPSSQSRRGRARTAASRGAATSQQEPSSESPSSSGSPTRHSPDEQDEREETQPARRRMNATQGRRPTMQDPDPAESDCSDENHSTVAEADSDDEWQSDAEATESEEVYDPLMDDTGEAEDGQPQAPRTLDGHRQTIAECVTGRGVLSHLASGLGDVNVRRNLGRDRAGVLALWGALSMTPAASRQEKLALDGDRLLLARDARAPRHGGPLSCPG
eukprot:TRINITY_DN312_c0_g1_i25.p1 TRINITY_DN312_c0_g1~~TRINITY_DN312_c0_g1_i25.p1  ORF type:complete len:628 (+),score=44.35 TRINITY_DN312_c0_g1_i25:2220-4103(+)